MIEEVHVAWCESDLPEPYVACLEVRQAELESDSPPPATLILYVRRGYPVERLREWLTMRLETLDEGYTPDQWGEPFHNDDDWVMRTRVRVHAVPKL